MGFVLLIHIFLYSGENKFSNPCRFCKFGHLQKKFVIYNCNGRCILTVRNIISTKKSRKLHFITFMSLFVFDAENKYLNPQSKQQEFWLPMTSYVPKKHTD